MSIVIPLPWDKPPATANEMLRSRHAKWQAVIVREMRDEARWAIRTAQIIPMISASVTLHFRPKGRQRRDADGMFPVLKAATDALVDEGILPDDSWAHVPAATCRIHPPNGEPAALWLELSEVVEYEVQP